MDIAMKKIIICMYVTSYLEDRNQQYYHDIDLPVRGVASNWDVADPWDRSLLPSMGQGLRNGKRFMLKIYSVYRYKHSSFYSIFRSLYFYPILSSIEMNTANLLCISAASPDLRLNLQKFKPWTYRYTLGAVNGLAYLHRHNIIHGNLKPSNILVSPYRRNIHKNIKQIDGLIFLKFCVCPSFWEFWSALVRPRAICLSQICRILYTA